MLNTFSTGVSVADCAIVLAVAFSIHYLTAWFRISTTNYKLPPGPASLPLVGNLFQFWSLNAKPIETLVYLTSFGELTTLWLGSCPVIVVNSPKAADDLLQKRAASTSSRPTHNTFLQEMLPNRLVLAPLGPEFRKLRTIYHDLLRPSGKIDFRKHQEEESLHLLAALRERPSDFLHECERFAINVILRPMYGSRLCQRSDAEIQKMYQVWRIMYLYFLPGTLPFDFIPVLSRIWSCMQPWHWLAARLKQQEAGLHTHLLRNLSHTKTTREAPATLASMLQLGCNTEGSKTDDQDLLTRTETIDILAMLLGAGSDTTSALLQNFFKVMAMHPQAVQRAQRELDSIIGTDRLPNWVDLEHLPYCQALLSELHRWSPIANIGIPHATTTLIEYAGFTIPKNTILIPNLPSLHRSLDVPGETDTFEPKRFLTAAKQADGSQKKRAHYHYGFGRRSCPGERIAEDSLLITVTRILWAFDIYSVANSPPLRMEEQRDGLLRKPKPFQVHISLRDPSRGGIIDHQYAQIPDICGAVDSVAAAATAAGD